MYDTQNNTGRKWHGFSVGIEIDLVVVWVIEIYLISEWATITYLISVWDRNWLGFMWRSKLTCSVSKLTWFLCPGASKLTFFSEGGSNWPGISVGIKMKLAVVWEIEIDLVLVRRSKLTCFCAGVKTDLVFCAGRKWLVFSVGIDWLGFCVGGRNWLHFWMTAGNHLVLLWASTLAWFFCGGRKWLVFSVWIEMNSFFVLKHGSRLVVRVEIEIYVISVMGSKLTWFLCAGSKLAWL